MGIDPECKGPEFLDAGNVLQGFMFQTSPDEVAITGDLLFGKGLIKIEI